MSNPEIKDQDVVLVEDKKDKTLEQDDKNTIEIKEYAGYDIIKENQIPVDKA